MPDTAVVAEKDVKVCSRCTENPRVSGSSWCRPCLNEYQRGYQDGIKERLKDSNFAKGAEQMRHALLAVIGSMAPTAHTTNGMIADWIRQFPAPRP